MGKIKDNIPYILFIALLMTVPILMTVIIADFFIEYKEAESNCKSNGWDGVGTRGPVLNKDFECGNYTKRQRDALLGADE